MTNSCCSFDAVPSSGGVVIGGSALVDKPNDPYYGLTCVLPLDEVGNGDEGEYVDRTSNHFDGTAGAVTPDGDTTTYPELDAGVFCLPSQKFSGRQLIHIDQDDLSANHDFTVSMWVKINTFGVPRVFYSRGWQDGTGKKYTFAIGHSFLNNVAISINTVDPPEEALYYGSTTLAQHTWYHVAATYTHNTIRMYVNGVIVATQVLDGDIIPLENECFLGCRDMSANLNGNLQEFHLFPEAKSANYLLAEYRSICAYFVTEGETEPLLYWKS